MIFACSAATGFCSGFVASFDRASLSVLADSVLEFFDSPACPVSVVVAESLDIMVSLKDGMFETVNR